MEGQSNDAISRFEDGWRSRRAEWARKLGRLRLGVEPLEEQLARLRRVALGLVVIPILISIFFLTLFAAFGRPEIGLVVVGLLLLPIAISSWIGYKRMERRVAAFRAEESQYLADRARLRETGAESGVRPPPP